MNHKLISPKNHVDKVYYAEIDKIVTEEDIKAFEDRITLDYGYQCMPLQKLEVLKADEKWLRSFSPLFKKGKIPSS